MSQSHSSQLRLLTPDQEAQVLAITNDLLTGNAAGVPDYLTEDIEAVRGQCGIRTEKIPVEPGIELDACIAWPRGEGPHPLIVMPAGLDQSGWKMYGGAIIRLLMRGYAVVAYTERGLAESGGELTVAGPEDVTDGRTVIDWALAHNDIKADPEKVGMAGISYGSGISQLVANEHPAVKAVVALSTWADLGEALYDNGTRHLAAAEALGSISDRPSAELTKVLESFRANTDIDEVVLAYARPRSPAKLDDEQRRPVPTFFTTFWHETIFPQNQLLDYFDRYPGPKRLDIAVGDHSALEVAGLMLGVYTRTTEAAYDWFDHYLLDVDNGIDRDGVVHTESMHTFTTATAPDLRSWWNPMRRYYFRAPATGSEDGTLTLDPPEQLSQSFQAGAGQVQAARTLVFDGILERLLMPNRQRLEDVNRAWAAVWRIPRAFLKAQHIAGIPKVKLTVTSSSRTATLITYLFDHNPFTGAMRIITHAAATLESAESGTPMTLEVDLQATDYHIPVGHRLVVVMGTVDHLYGAASDRSATVITLSNDKGSGYLDLPIAP
ncbi:CocE/NonD family hydrolase [Nocardia sp. CDC160]|uniref:CocE/NonD family hydrolase n=1 Tax=Nocardia sp. CDC160 TaxID=3112166 RepID=UPI002DBC1CC3|nr:CocE/NonD family hydrolase [Nocardia sp. CDC160]MEC3915927.1 CocE/NonD family hydrolase [Nocardia sp. CDC160]